MPSRKLTASHYRDVKKWRQRNPDKARAHCRVQRAIKRGKLERQPCQWPKCNRPASESEGHHDDYSRPLDVRWLCRTHHKRWHREHPDVEPMPFYDWQHRPTRKNLNGSRIGA